MGVSALLGLGFDELVSAVGGAREEYFNDYYPEMEKLKLKKQQKELKRYHLPNMVCDGRSMGVHKGCGHLLLVCMYAMAYLFRGQT